MRSSAACLTLLFILSLSVVSMTCLQPVGAETTTAKYYFQSGDPTTVPHPPVWGAENVYGLPPILNMTAFNMDTPTPHGFQVACSWCDFATRPLVNHYVFRSFKLHLNVRWSTQCDNWTKTPETAISYGIGSASSDLSTIYGYQYKDYSYWVTSREVTVLDIALSGYDVNVGLEVRVGIDTGKRLVVHFGLGPTMLGSDAPCLVGGSIAKPQYYADPTILFGDAEHASYIETDAVDLQGQPVPEFPSFLIMLPVILALTILLRREQNRRLGRSPK
jgi:hypothetical protein